jgi:tetratricopeptide (TPR) repeat protein
MLRNKKIIIGIVCILLFLAAAAAGGFWLYEQRSYTVPVVLTDEGRVRLEAQRDELLDAIKKGPVEGGDLYAQHLDLGHTYAALGDGRTAEKAYKRAAKIRPKVITPYLSLGNLARQTQRYRAAVQYYEKALETDSADLDAYLALIHLKRDNFKAPSSEVTELYERAAAKVGNPTELHRDFARFLETLKTQEARLQAIDHWREVLKRLPNDVEAKTSIERLGG